MLSPTTGRVASITGRDRSESTCPPCQSLLPPAGAVTFRSSAATRFSGSETYAFARACRSRSIQDRFPEQPDARRGAARPTWRRRSGWTSAGLALARVGRGAVGDDGSALAQWPLGPDGRVAVG